MRILIVGAGASIEEAKRVNTPKEFWPPAISNFAEKMWDSPYNQFFNYWLPDYLNDMGVDPGVDPTSEFIRLVRNPEGSINVERLFEYCWLHKDKKHKGAWEDLISHGILNPLTFLLLQAFFENGIGIKELQAGALVVSRLHDGDVVVNLNYDTLFEIAATQRGRRLTYVPNKFDGRGLLIAKPHGSLNLLADETPFWFAQPDCIGALPSNSDNFRNHFPIVPPRFNKTYNQHPIAKIIFSAIKDLRPDIVTFWGVGLTDSDIDLLSLYRHWISRSTVIEVINPDKSVSLRIKEIFQRDVTSHMELESWL